MSPFVWEEHVTPRIPLWRWSTWRGPSNLRGRPIFLPANGSITHEIVCCTLAVISKINTDSLLLLPFNEKGGVFGRCFPFYWDQISNKNAIWTNIVTLILKKLTQANCLQLIESCSPLHNKGRCGYSIVRKVSWNFKGATLIKLQPASNLIMSFPIFQLIMRHHSGKQPLSE